MSEPRNLFVTGKSPGGEFRPPDGTRDDIQVRAEEFVRDCFLLFGQNADAENAELVRSVAAKVRQSIP